MIEYNKIHIGKQIKKYREIKNISQRKLGELTGISAGYIGDIERGGKTKNSSVSMKNICKIAEVLGVSIDDLAGDNLEYKKLSSDNEIFNKIARELDSMSINKLEFLQKLISILLKDNIKNSK